MFDVVMEIVEGNLVLEWSVGNSRLTRFHWEPSCRYESSFGRVYTQTIECSLEGKKTGLKFTFSSCFF